MSGGEVELTARIKTVMDISDVKANVGVLQSQFNKLKLPSGITDKFNQEISKFSSTYEKYQQKMSQGIKTKGDATQTSKYLNEIAREYDNIVKTYSKASGLDLKSMFKVDSGPLKEAAAEVERLTKQLENVDINKTGFQNLSKQLSGILKNSKFSGEHGLINEMIGHFEHGEVDKAKQALQEIQKEVEKRQYTTTTDKNGNTIQKPGTYSEANTTAMLSLINQLMAAADQAGIKIQDIQGPLSKATQHFDDLLNKGVTSFKSIGDAAQGEKAAVHGVVEENKNLVNSMASAQQQSQMLTNRIAMYFSLYEIIRKIGDVAKRAFQTVKELDASMTQTAVVTNFSVGDMWEQLPQYTATANKLGSTIKDVYDATTLYYQQGLNTNQAMGVATETLKMARIGGLQAAEATDMMTAALRGFNMQINELSAQRINDVYSKLAAITASNTEELGSAMTRTASIANSAGMEFETTSAFLAQMIETTREAPENLGTAMKTIVARFQEMKKAPEDLKDSEGELLDVNRVDKALKSVGIALTNTKGEFRDLDEVFLEIAQKWDSLSMGQQRYIATMAAGSRQQSRFIAMMSNYDRTMELVDAANNSAGASTEQFNKTLESMDTKLNKLKNAWDQFAMGLTNNTILKGVVDGLTSGITIINKFIDAIGNISPEPFKNINKSLLTLVGTLGALRLGGSAFFKHQGLLGGLLTGASKFFQGESFSTIGKEMAKGMSGFDLTLAGDNAAQSFYQGMFNKIRASKGEVQQVLGDSLNPNYVKVISLSDFLQLDDVSLQDKGRAIIDALRAGLASNNNLSEEMRIKGEEALKKLEEPFVAGHRSVEHMMKMAAGFANYYEFNFDPKVIGVEKLNKSILETGNAFTTTGAKLQRFGNMLRNTPLEPFGKLLTIAGNALSTIGITLTLIKSSIVKSTIALAADTVAWLANTDAIHANNEELAKNGIIRTSDDGKQITKVLKPLEFLKSFKLGTVLKGLAGKLTGFLGKLAGIAPQLIGIALAVGMVYNAWKLLNWRSDSLKEAKTRAANASEAFSNLKQEASELKDKLEELNEIDTAFESLVSGTAEFNEKLMESNALITELINKYPMLNDSKYLSTDKNGRLILNEEGREAVQQDLKQKQANAQSLSLMAAQDVKDFDPEGWLKDFDKSNNELHRISQEYIQRSEGLIKETETAAGNIIKTYNPSHARITEQAKTEAKNQGIQTPDEVIKAHDAEVAANNKVAVTSLFSGLDSKDFINKDKLTNVFGESYQSVLENIEADKGEKARAQAYARFYGYDEYLGKNKFRKGTEEVEIDKSKWNDELTNKRIKANELMIDSAAEVDAALSHFDSAASEVFSDLSSNSLISDILSNNVETNRDDLAKILSSGKIGELVSQMSEADIEALKTAGIEDAQTFIEERARAIQDTQSLQDVDLASKMARATGETADWLNGGSFGAVKQIGELQDRLESLSQAERTFASDTSDSLEKAFDTTVADKFINTYTKGSDKLRNKFKETFEEVDWTSSIDALGAMQGALNSGNKELEEFGKAMKESSVGSHLINDALQDLWSQDDFNEVVENLDKFVDESGKLNAVGIKKMAEESSSLAKMLNTGALSAGTLAAAINATSEQGEMDITDLSDSVLKLIGYFSQLDDAIASAHDYIENFNPGIDTGESKDFITENVKKAKEFAENGEWGNDQFINYVQSVIGPDRWQAALKSVGGNTEKAYNKIKGYLNGFSEGYDKMWMNLVNKTDVTGKDITKKVDKNLRDITMTYDENGDLQLDLAGHSIEDFNKFLQQAEGVTKEQADLMIEDWKNYSYDFAHDWETKKFQTALKDTDYVKEHQIIGENGKVTGTAITQSEIDTLAAATGKTAEEVAKEIGKATGAKIKKNKDGTYGFQNKDAEGNFKDNYKDLARDFNTYLGIKKGSFINQKEFANGEGGYDIQSIINGYIQKGFTETQAQGMALEQMKENKGEKYTYNGKEIDPSQFKNATQLLEEFSNIDESVHWESIGEQIAQGFINVIKGEDNNPKPTDEGPTTDRNGGITGGLKEEDKGTTYVPGVGVVGKNGKPTQNPEIPNQGTFWQGSIGKGLVDFFSFKWLGKGTMPSVPLQGTPLAGQTIPGVGFIPAKGAFEAAPIWKKEESKNVPEQTSSGVKNLDWARPDVVIKDLTGLLSKFKDYWPTETKQEEKPKGLQIPEGMEQVFNPKTGGLEYKKIEEGADGASASLNNVNEGAEGATSGLKGLSSAIQSFISGLNLPSEKKPSTTTTIPGVGVVDKSGKVQNRPQEQTSGYKVDNSGAIQPLEEVQNKANETNKTIEKPHEYKVTKKYVEDKGESRNKPKNEKVNVQYNTNGKVKGEPGNLEKTIQYTAAKKIKNEPGNLNRTINYTANMPYIPSSRTITLYPKFAGVWKKTVDIEPGSRGFNNTGTVPSVPNAGSLARGNGRPGTGRIGPKGKGGLTLTGELGYEVAWLPSEDRSMILGANGPEMLNLPGDAVVWNHEQSKKIVKQKSIPTGTAAIGAGSVKSGRHVKDSTKNDDKKDRKNNGGRSSGGNGSNGKKNKGGEVLVSGSAKILKKLGKVSVWWENISKRVATAERLATKNQKTFEKELKRIGATANDVQIFASNYTKYLQKQVSLNREIVNKYIKDLDKLLTNGGKNGTGAEGYTINKKGKIKKANKAEKELTLAKAEYEVAKDTKSKKDDKKAKSRYKKAKAAAKKREKQAKADNPAVRTVTYEDTIKVTTKKGKKTKTRKQKVKSKKTVDFSKILYEDEDGNILINQKALDKAAGKNKKAKQAIKEKALKLADEKQKRRDDAQDKLEAANESLRQVGEQIYDNFLGWKNELTKIWEITRKIAALEAKREKLESAQDLTEAMLSAGTTGLLANFTQFSGDIAKSIARSYGTTVKQSANAIEQLKSDLAAARNVSIDNEEVKRQQEIVNKYKDKKESELTDEENMEYQQAKGFVEKATATLEAQKLANERYLTFNEDGSIKSFNAARLEADKQNMLINEATYQAIKDYVDNIQSIEDELNSQINAQIQALTELNNQIAELREQYAGYADDLLQAYEDQEQSKVDVLENIYSSLNDHFKDLIDTVKKDIDKRRQTEDNAKTEREIAQKQQRLALLRANTAGGNKVEIAQLEKEIADAQQNYGRTLEDQLLSKLEEQADLAAKQREQQIKLLNAQLQIAHVTGVNAKHIDELMAGIAANNAEAIKEAQELFYSANEYYSSTEARKVIIANDFTALTTNIQNYDSTMQTLNQTLIDLQNYLSDLQQALQDLFKETIEDYGVATTTVNVDDSGRRQALLERQKDNSKLIAHYTSLRNSTHDEKEKDHYNELIKKLEDENKEIDDLLAKLPEEIQEVTFTLEDQKAILDKLGIHVDENYTGLHSLTKEQLSKLNAYSVDEIAGIAGLDATDAAGFLKMTKALQNIVFNPTIVVNEDGSAQVGNTTIPNSGFDQEALRKADALGATEALGKQESQRVFNEKVGTVKKDKKLTGSELTSVLDLVKSERSITGFDMSDAEVFKALAKTDELTWVDVMKAAEEASGFSRTDLKKIAEESGDKNAQKALEKIYNDLMAGYTEKSDTSASQVEKALYWGEASGKSKGDILKEIATGKSTWTKVLKAFIEAIGDKAKAEEIIRAFWGSSPTKTEKTGFENAFGKKYAAGGMNYTTGPAWLDGTRAKPEAVLSATDTKNFIQLRDVLSSLMSGVSSISSNVQSGQVTYDIDINVDHIASDYDVDRIATRIEQKIVHDASYRNVNVVRNLR